ncbi:unnamed protein product [Owenia fusiformis]|uniref:SRCR domain-containing protein n=1 Tax=Owenia fusiformis TaxID=6347 RepID=A0A8S4P7J7_OWEFU|nr:unnamed protein product [Owenia fusiformis]
MLLYYIIAVLSTSGVMARLAHDFDARLTGNEASQGQGRVEVYFKRKWRRVCNYGWDVNDAKVICRQLGYDPEGSETQIYKSDTKAHRRNPKKWGGHGRKGRKYGVQNVKCNGNETFIGQCETPEWLKTPKCEKNHDAIAICKKDESNATVRITDTGVIELKHEGVWGTVMNPGNTKLLADVACRQLGYEFGLKHRYWPKTVYRGPIWNYTLICEGSARNLQDCKTEFRNYTDSMTLLTGICEPKFRLRKGLITSGLKSGLLEVFVSNKWYLACEKSPYKGCKWLGLETKYARTTEVTNDTSYEVAYIACRTGYRGEIDETELSKCQTIISIAGDWKRLVQSPGMCKDIVLRNKLPYEIACPDGPESAVSEAIIKLDKGSHGDLKVKVNDTWLLVCGYRWSWYIGFARTICRQLGFESDSNHVGIIQIEWNGYSAKPFIFTDIKCLGSEKHIRECRFSEWNVETGIWGHRPVISCNVSSIRLSEGRYGDIQVFLHDTWLPMCTRNWDMEDSKALCKHLGFKTGRVFIYKYISPSHNYVHTGGRCIGTEKSMYYCRSFSLGRHCHSDFASTVYMSCDMFNDIQIRLKDSVGSLGKPEIVNINKSICSNNWTKTEASIICDSLGFPPEHAIPIYHEQRTFPDTSTFVKFECQATDSGSVCKCVPRVCEYYNVGVKCLDHQPGIDEYIRAKTEFPYLGQVEVNILNNQRGAVCATGWGIKETQVLCRQTGAFNKANRKPMYVSVDSNNVLGGRADPIVMSDVKCNGDEANIAECTFKSGDEASCSSNRRVSVYCHQLRVWMPPKSGLIKVFSGEKHGWRWICGDNFDKPTADVFCFTATGERRAYKINADYVAFRNAGPYVRARRVRYIPFWNGIMARLAHDFDARLTGNEAYKGQGRVEVYFQRKWRRVCNYGWDVNDAKVICRQLGYDPDGSNTQIYKSGYVYTFQKNNDAIAICKKDESDAQVRISDTGVIELKHEGVWGTVINPGELQNIYQGHPRLLANVACRQLGYEFGLKHKYWPKTVYRGPIWNYTLICEGSESNLQDCKTEIRNHTDSMELVTGICEPKFRLRKGLITSGLKSGLLEVFVSNKWHLACGVPSYKGCKWLGLETRYARTTDTKTNDISYEIAYIDCVTRYYHRENDETELSKCQGITSMAGDWALFGHSPGLCYSMYSMFRERLPFEIACPDEPDSAVSAAVIKLDKRSHGEVKVNVNDTWLLVCGNDWAIGFAKTICQQLGYESGLAQVAITFVVHRLSEGTYGNIQAYIRDKWFTMCTSVWDVEDVKVLCKHLGLNIGTVFLYKHPPPDHFIYSSKSCNGSEKSIYDCRRFGFGFGCSWTYHFSVYMACNMSNDIKIHLKDSDGSVGKPFITNFNKGLCSENWTKTEASIICENLGFPPEHAIAIYNQQRTAPHRSNYMKFECQDTDSGIVCGNAKPRVTASRCDYYNIGVQCLDYQPGIHEYIRAKTEFPFMGQVEVYISQDHRGAVCATGWGIKETQVLCRQTGAFNEPDRKPMYVSVDSNNVLGGRADPIVMSDVKCNGDEANIAECTFKSGDEASCSSNRRVSVYCHQLRVWMPPKSGLIKVFSGEKHGWRWICGDSFDKPTADVFCFTATGERRAYKINADYVAFRDAGPYVRARRVRYIPFWNGRIYEWPAIQIKCLGNEYSLGQCDFRAIYNNCTQLAFLGCRTTP